MGTTTFQTLNNGEIWATNTSPIWINGYGYIGNTSNTYLYSAASTAAPASVSTVTGVNPTETSYALYGHIIPLSVFGVGRIGGDIISGPWFASGAASFIISFGVPADPSGTRTLREIAFDSEVVWTSSGGFASEAFTFRFYGGTLSQSADALETAHFGGDAVAYRPQMLIAFENLPLANTKFGKIPYVAAVIADASGDDVNFGEAFERLAYSPWVGLTSSKFATSGVTDGVASGGLIISDQTNFLQLIQYFARFYPNWDILQTDKLRIVDRGSTVSPDIVLNTTTLCGNVTVNRQGADTVTNTLELSTIDPDADYTIVPFRATLPHDPVAVTTSIGTDSAYLPVIMDASTRAAITTFTKYHEELTRKTVSATAMGYGLQIEPGDLVQISDLGDDFSDDIFRVKETTHGVNYMVEFTAEPILKCTFVAPSGTASWNPSDKTAHISLSGGDLIAEATDNNLNGVRGITSHTSGKWYFEIKTGATYYTSGGMPTGICTGSADLTTIGSTSAHAFTVNPGGNILLDGSNPIGSPSIGSYYTNAVISVAIDLTNMRGWFRLNGGNWNGNATYDPATNVGGVDISSVFGVHAAYPYQSLNANGVYVTANFGGTSFLYTMPTGFSAWS